MLNGKSVEKMTAGSKKLLKANPNSIALLFDYICDLQLNSLDMCVDNEIRNWQQPSFVTGPFILLTLSGMSLAGKQS
jgi:hypothetical protein